MKVVNLSNYFNHHQKPLADALHNRLNDGFKFVETSGVPEFRKKLGYLELKAPYVLNYEGNEALVERLLMEADVVIYGEAPLELIKPRYNSGKLTFRDDESRYKNPNRYLKWPVYTYKSHWINKGYLLSASAYAPIDYLMSGIRPSKCFRWGYFPEVKKYIGPETLMKKKELKHPQGVSILWAGRLIGLKHPEAAIHVAKKLKDEGVDFELNIIGTGILENKIRELIRDGGLENNVHMLGSMTPAEVRTNMEEADIFLFTSDRCEGWGAVLNESMNSGCAVVADGNIGSVPYLIKDGVNGLIYKSTNWGELYKKVSYLVHNPKEREQIGKNAYSTMLSLWNGEVAAKSFIELCESILNNTENPIKEGPCSNAPLLMRTFKGKFKVL